MADFIDLRGDGEIVAQLINEHKRWRVRSVERISLSSALWAERRRTLDIGPLRGVLQPYLPRDARSKEKAWLTLPIAIFPKEPLLGFELTVNGEEVSRLSRIETARMQADYIARLSSKAGMRAKVPQELLVAICKFAPAPWIAFQASVGDQLYEYLTSDGQRLTDVEYRALSVWSQVIQGHLMFLGLGNSSHSAADNPLLALPDLLKAKQETATRQQNPRLPSLMDLEPALEQLARFLEECKRLAQSSHKNAPLGRKILKTYVDYGRRWVALGECEVPLDCPFIVAMSERRAVSVKKDRALWDAWCLRGVIPLEAVFNDALSNHVAIEMTDPIITLVEEKIEPLRVNGAPLKGRLDVNVCKPELCYISSSDPLRNHQIQVPCALQQSLLSRLIHWIIFGIILLTLAAVVLSYPLLHGLTPARLAMLLAPSTFASALLLIRDSSPLSGDLTRALRRVIGVILASLWGAAVCLYLMGQVKDPPIPEVPRNDTICMSPTTKFVEQQTETSDARQ
ncbi:hypothetical protein [Streptomyces sp. NPDC093514]|uniref:hypothetical protein n=1 Tax=Streptomyces sp. NPDC093514 TaxID=3366039 RepID=UPI0038098A8E